MKRLVEEALLPGGLVLIAIAALTLGLFGPPPPRPLVEREDLATSAPAMEPAARPKPDFYSETPAAVQTSPVPEARTTIPPSREAQSKEMNAVVARAVRALSEPAQPSPVANAELAAAVRQLGEAVDTARNARDDRDLARAEELLREARTKMERSCGAPNSPLCESARSIRRLGY